MRHILFMAVACCALAALTGCDDSANDQDRTDAPVAPAPPKDFYKAPQEPAKLALTPPTYDFGQVMPGTTKQAVLTVANSGEAPAMIGAAAIAGPPGYAVTTDTCGGRQLRGGQNCTVTVAFTADAAQQPGRAVLTLGADQSGPPLTASLSAFLPPPPPPELPPPPPTGPTEEELLRAERERIANQRIEDRRAAGPKFAVIPAKDVPPPPKKWKLEDEDWSREDVPTRLTSFPVDRSFTITPFRQINVVLKRPIDTQLPGEGVFMITEDVYGADGKYKLLEAGDLALARYIQPKKQGDSRVNFQVYRIERTGDGSTVYAAGPGEHFGYVTDAIGRAGLSGQVFNRTWEKFEMATYMAGLSTVPPAAVASIAPNNQNLGTAMSAWGTQLSQTAAEDLKSKIDMAPIIQVTEGEIGTIQLKDDILIRRPEEIKPKTDKTDPKKDRK